MSGNNNSSNLTQEPRFSDAWTYEQAGQAATWEAQQRAKQQAQHQQQQQQQANVPPLFRLNGS